MIDPVLAILHRLRDHAESVGAEVDRVEVELNRDHTVVAFVAHMIPKPLAHSTAAIGYDIRTGKEVR